MTLLDQNLFLSFFLGEYEKAAKLCPRVLGEDAKSWEGWVFLFAQSNQLQVTTQYVHLKPR